jgi:hypothetical protein
MKERVPMMIQRMKPQPDPSTLTTGQAFVRRGTMNGQPAVAILSRNLSLIEQTWQATVKFMMPAPTARSAKPIG